jgi:hypothetical protein
MKKWSRYSILIESEKPMERLTGTRRNRTPQPIGFQRKCNGELLCRRLFFCSMDINTYKRFG